MPLTSLAIDLGASSGRALLGAFDGSTLSLRELHRFPNTPLSLPSGLHWDTPRLFEHIKHSLSLAAREATPLSSVGIDTWGVDYALLSERDELLGLPHHYRDPRTARIMDDAFRLVPRETIYARTGIQFMPLNTIYQLLADRRTDPRRLDAARTLLFTPDLLNFWLTGVKRSEHTIASTSQLYDTGAAAWATDLMSALGLPASIFPDAAPPGSPLGPLLPAIAEETGVRNATVIAPGSHDTASAVAAVPATGAPSGAPPGAADWAYVSSGTWSLVGRELAAPLRTPAALAANFTNEGGVAGTIRFHKNVAGLWLLQECQRVWALRGSTYSFDQLAAMATAGTPFATLVDPDDPAFAEHGDMPDRLRTAARRGNQPIPDSDAAIVQCILESLALKCRQVIDTLESLTGPVRTIHIVGGGCRNATLCQFTANACARPVLAGPIEATAAGNVMVQALGQRHVASLADIRTVIAASVKPTRYDPRDTAAWAAALERMPPTL